MIHIKCLKTNVHQQSGWPPPPPPAPSSPDKEFNQFLMYFITKKLHRRSGWPPPDSWGKNPDWGGLPVAGGGDSFHGRYKL